MLINENRPFRTSSKIYMAYRQSAFCPVHVLVAYRRNSNLILSISIYCNVVSLVTEATVEFKEDMVVLGLG